VPRPRDPRGFLRLIAELQALAGGRARPYVDPRRLHPYIQQQESELGRSIPYPTVPRTLSAGRRRSGDTSYLLDRFRGANAVPEGPFTYPNVARDTGPPAFETPDPNLMRQHWAEAHGKSEEVGPLDAARLFRTFLQYWKTGGKR